MRPTFDDVLQSLRDQGAPRPDHVDRARQSAFWGLHTGSATLDRASDTFSFTPRLSEFAGVWYLRPVGLPAFSHKTAEFLRAH